MDAKIGMIMLIALAALFGCTGTQANDCSKCNTTNSTAEYPKAEISMLVPTACPEDVCNSSKVNSWAGELGLGVRVFKADWAQGPILLFYADDSAYVFNKMPADRGSFMNDICGFVNSTKACAIANEEFGNESSRIKSCLAGYGVSLGTVAFYHASWCPHCLKMAPWVENTEKLGYRFLWAQIDDPGNRNATIAAECLSSVLKLGEGIPQFACPSNGKLQIGEFPSEADLVKFAADCAAAAKVI